MSNSTGTPVWARVWHRLRFFLHGHRAGLGQPVPVLYLDREYSSGHWDHFFSPEEKPRHEALIELILSTNPRPRLLDLGCGSGRLASLLQTQSITHYLGVDISTEGLRLARSLHLTAPMNRFEQRDFEKWTPKFGAYDVITFNECLGYAPDPLRTAQRFASTLTTDGAIIVSHFCAGNHEAFWRRLSRGFEFTQEKVVSNGREKTWTLRVLRNRPR